jgi:hypothetical protein
MTKIDDDDVLQHGQRIRVPMYLRDAAAFDASAHRPGEPPQNSRFDSS